MKFIPSAYFGNDLGRYLWKNYPTKIFRNAHFELDEAGQPQMVAPYVAKTIGLFGGEVIEGVVVVDPVTGNCADYPVNEVPSWVDIVYDGDLLEDLYNYYGTLQKGFWNSIFGQIGCKATTDDYGYLADPDDVMIFTGVTSLVAEDHSNIGFLMANERTGEMFFIQSAGSDESSAMAAAEGEVQEKEYVASFPTLAKVGDDTVYVLLLKDKAGYVKSYAVVDATQVNNVVVAQSKAEAISKFAKLKGTNSTAVADGQEAEEIAVQGFEMTCENGISKLTVTLEDGSQRVFVVE